MIPEVSRIHSVLHSLESFGPTACDGNCNPDYDPAIADAKFELTDFEAEAEANIDPAVLADPALIAQFEPAIAALEAKLADLASLVQPLPKTTELRGLALTYWSHAIELSAPELRDLVLAIGRITNGVVQPGDEATIEALPDPRWLTHPVYGPWVIVATLTLLVTMDYVL